MSTYIRCVECGILVTEHHESASANTLRWIPFSERRPTEADANEQGYVVARYESGAIQLAYANLLNRRLSIVGFAAWHPLAKHSPPIPGEIEAHGRTYVLKEDK